MKTKMIFVVMSLLLSASAFAQENDKNICRFYDTTRQHHFIGQIFVMDGILVGQIGDVARNPIRPVGTSLNLLPNRDQLRVNVINDTPSTISLNIVSYISINNPSFTGEGGICGKLAQILITKGPSESRKKLSTELIHMAYANKELNFSQIGNLFGFN